MTPSIGRIVHYMLSASDADQINRRRTDSRTIARRLVNLHWHEGAQAHIGNGVKAGDVLPMMIVAVDPPGDPDVGSVSGQVFLDGTDIFWAQHRAQVATDSTDKQGLWFEPPRVPAATLTPTTSAAKAETPAETTPSAKASKAKAPSTE